MSPTAAPADTRTASEQAVASQGHALPHSQEADVAESRPAASPSNTAATRSRLPVLLLLLLAVATAAGLFATLAVPRLSGSVPSAPDVLAPPDSALSVAAVVLGLALLLGITATRLARALRRVALARRDRRPDPESATGALGVGEDRRDEEAASAGDGDAREDPVVVTATPSAADTRAADPSVGVPPALSISSHALELQVRCLEATLAEQDEVLAQQERALDEQRAALDEARELADREAAAAREVERRRVRATVHALRDVVAVLPGHVAADRLATALGRLSVDPGFDRPLLAPLSDVGLPVVFAAPAPPREAAPAPAPDAPAALAPTSHDEPVLTAHQPVPSAPAAPAPVAPSVPAGTVAGPDTAPHTEGTASVERAAAPAPPVKVLPVPAPAPAPAPARARRVLRRSRSS